MPVFVGVQGCRERVSYGSVQAVGYGHQRCVWFVGVRSRPSGSAQVTSSYSLSIYPSDVLFCPDTSHIFRSIVTFKEFMALTALPSLWCRWFTETSAKPRELVFSSGKLCPESPLATYQPDVAIYPPCQELVSSHRNDYCVLVTDTFTAEIRLPVKISCMVNTLSMPKERMWLLESAPPTPSANWTLSCPRYGNAKHLLPA